MGAYLHYGLINKLFVPVNPKLSPEENDSQARKRMGQLMPLEDLNIAKGSFSSVAQVPESLLRQHLGDFIERFKNLYSSDLDESWDRVLTQSWETMSREEIEDLAKKEQPEHFWFDESADYEQRSGLDMELFILQSEGKVVCEYLDGALEMLTRLIRKELAPNPLAPYFYAWIS